MMDKKNKILICSSNPASSEPIKLALEKKGYKVYDIVSSGKDLILAALNYYPSLIITDITLKGEIDGIETISRLTGISKIPYIFIADSSDQISLIDSYFLSPVKVFTKPVNPDDLYFFINDSTGYSNDTRYSNYYLG